MSSVLGEVEAAFVHYRTPDLTRACVWALRTCYPHLSITVLDNGAGESGHVSLAALAEAVPFTLVESAANLHHGPGLDALLRRATRPFVLLMDTDAFCYKPGVVEALHAALADGAYLAGQIVAVDADGFNAERDAPGAIPYVHPHCALVRRAAYLGLPPFEKHGAPALANQRAALARGLRLAAVPVGDFVWHAGRGTVARHGYSLGWRDRLRALRRKLMG